MTGCSIPQSPPSLVSHLGNKAGGLLMPVTENIPRNYASSSGSAH